MITVIGAGTGCAENITVSALNAIKKSSRVFLSTEKMPLTRLLKENNIVYEAFDEIFENAEDFDALNLRIKERLESESDCVYIVHGSGIDDTGVMALDKDKITVIPGISVADAVAARLCAPSNHKDFTALEVLSGVLPSPHNDTVITCIDSKIIASDLKCVLTDIYGDEYTVDYYCEDFDGNVYTASISLYECDMQKNYNHTASLFIKKQPLEAVERYDIFHLLEIMNILSSRNGCPWDSAQTHTSLRPYLIEEAYEVAEAIDNDDMFALADELGDVLFQVVFHGCIGAKSGDFNFNDITDNICKKMISRHPQLFGGEKPDGDINDLWENIKKKEKNLSSTADVMRNVPEILPSLVYCEKIIHKATKAGITLQPKEQNIDEITHLLADAETEDALGEVLFKAVALCMNCGVHPELALHKRVLKYIGEFEKNEK